MEQPNHERVRVLVVEDNQDALSVLVRLLTKLDCAALGCTDGAMAIETARIHHPHLILLDLSMPGMDGFETARRLQNEQLPPFKLVALTAFGDTETMRHCAEVGFECHVQKPIQIADLRVLITEARDVLDFVRT